MSTKPTAPFLCPFVECDHPELAIGEKLGCADCRHAPKILAEYCGNQIGVGLRHYDFQE